MTKQIQIIARAVFIFSAMLLASCDSCCVRPPSIVGKWQLDGNLYYTIEFFPDGTLLEKMPLRNDKGKYVLLERGRVKIETEGIFWGTNVEVHKYSINGDKMTMTPEGGTGPLNYTRIK